MQGGHAIEAAFCKLKSGRQIQLLTLARLGHDQAGLMQGPGFAGGGQPGAIIYAGPATAPASSPPPAAPAAVEVPPDARQAPRRGLADDARDVLSSVGRLFRPRR